jgi:hypothetical protein
VRRLFIDHVSREDLALLPPAFAPALENLRKTRDRD